MKEIVNALRVGPDLRGRDLLHVSRVLTWAAPFLTDFIVESDIDDLSGLCRPTKLQNAC
jgi:hypothetical protein